MFRNVMDDIKNDRNKKMIVIFTVSAFLIFLLFALMAIFNNGKIIEWMIMGGDEESDYYRQIVYAADLKNIYFNTDDAPFPPFSYLFYHLLFVINPFEAPVKLSSYRIARDAGFNKLVYMIIMCMHFALFYKAVELHLKKRFSSNISFLFTTAVVFSIPYLFGSIEKGNIIFLVISMMLIALYLKDSDSKIYREIAMILIAMCAATKVYPAILGLLYLKEKRFKEAIRLIAYGVLFVFVPFIFTGGLNGLIQYLSVLKVFQTRTIPRYTSISPMLLAVVDTFAPQMDKIKVLPFNIAIQTLYLLINVVSLFKCKRKSIALMLIGGILSIYVPDSYRYTAGYMIIPFVMLLLEEKIRKIDYVYFLLFTLIFTIPVYAYVINVSVIDFCVFFPIYIMSLVAYYDVWIKHEE